MKEIKHNIATNNLTKWTVINKKSQIKNANFEKGINEELKGNKLQFIKWVYLTLE